MISLEAYCVFSDVDIFFSLLRRWFSSNESDIEKCCLSELIDTAASLPLPSSADRPADFSRRFSSRSFAELAPKKSLCSAEFEVAGNTYYMDVSHKDRGEEFAGVYLCSDENNKPHYVAWDYRIIGHTMSSNTYVFEPGTGYGDK